jgi:hypothetical protein
MEKVESPGAVAVFENRGQNGFSPTAAKNNSVPLRVSLQTAITTPNPSLIRRGTRFFS